MITTQELAAQVALLGEQIAEGSPKAVTTIDAITYELDRLRQSLVTQACRDMDELLARGPAN